jgi:hypothetical protein
LSTQSEERIRCATWNKAQEADPVGTIGSYRSFLLIEWPLPWPKDLAEILPQDLTSELRANKCRLQGLVPEGIDSPRTIVFYQGGCDGLFASFLRSEVTVDAIDVVDAVRQLIAGRGPQPAKATTTDLLVCTHGRRDRCCGALGTRLAIDLVSDPTVLGTTTRIWRTSHTGGHRFAPTVLVFPKGTGWAFADTALLRKVVTGHGELGDVLGCYRGCVGLNSPRIQAVERVVLDEVGWGLFDMRRRGWEKSDGRVLLEVELPTAQMVTWEADVRDGRVIDLPECGEPFSDYGRTATELVVESVHLST